MREIVGYISAAVIAMVMTALLYVLVEVLLHTPATDVPRACIPAITMSAFFFFFHTASDHWLLKDDDDEEEEEF